MKITTSSILLLTLLVTSHADDDVTNSQLMTEHPIEWAISKLTDMAIFEDSYIQTDSIDSMVARHEVGTFPLSRENQQLVRGVADDVSRSTAGFPQVTTQNGAVIGKTLTHAHAFYSIPYAKPPVGERRFMAPEELEIELQPSTSDHSEQDYRMCWQITDDCEKYPCTMTEDCLVMNIHVPVKVDLSNPTSASLPVMVWIHGGFFFKGAGTNPETDGELITKTTQSIIVGINYRLGPFGFMSALDKQGNKHFNQGLKDQQLALKWLQQNIHKFGGDKDKVTIFGESAGAQSVMFHMLSPVSEPLFARGIMQSNPAAFEFETFDQSVHTITTRTLQALKCADEEFECLWTKTAEEITHTRNKVMITSLLNGELFNGVEPYRPIIDGVEFTDVPLELFRRGEWQTHKPVLIGTNQEEMSYVSAVLAPISVGKKLFEVVNRLVIGDEYLEAVVDKYATMATGRPRDYSLALAQEVTDMMFYCPNRAMARFAAETTSSDVFVYINGHSLDDPGCSEGFGFTQVCNTSFHSSEIPVVFGNERGYNMTFTMDDHLMTNMFDDYWGSFSEVGKPSPSTKSLGEFIAWPKYTSANQWAMMWLDADQRLETTYRDDFCDLWDTTDFYLKKEEPTAATTKPITAPQTTETTTTKPITAPQTTETTTEGTPLTKTTAKVPDVIDTTMHDYDYDGGHNAGAECYSVSMFVFSTMMLFAVLLR